MRDVCLWANRKVRLIILVRTARCALCFVYLETFGCHDLSEKRFKLWLWNNRHVTFDYRNKIVWADKSSVIKANNFFLLFIFLSLSAPHNTTCSSIGRVSSFTRTELSLVPRRYLIMNNNKTWHAVHKTLHNTYLNRITSLSDAI